MTEIRNISYRLLPCTVAKARALSRLAGACRFVWNEMLDQQEQIYWMARMNGAKPPSPTFFTLGKAFTQLRRVTPWLQDLPFAPVRYTLKYQADAWRAFFHGQRGRPRFKGRRGDDGFTIPDHVRVYRGRIFIPKLGWYVLRRRGGNPYPEGSPRQAIVKRNCGKWYCTVSYAVEVEEPMDNGLAIGVDRNVRQVAVSTGDIVRSPDMTRLEARRKRYQRMIARRRKGSNRRRRAGRMLAKTHRRIAKKRLDWHHRTTRQLADTAAEIVLEDLPTRGMTRSAKGTPSHPGSNVKAKSGLNREILATGWHRFETMLNYKAHTVTLVPAAFTSQRCHRCGTIDASNRRTQAKFRCVQCGHQGNADVNAALNILASGTGATGRRGALALVTPMNRQEIYDESEPHAVGFR